MRHHQPHSVRLRRALTSAFLIIALVGLAACGSSRLFRTITEAIEDTERPPDSTLAYRIFMIGDTGEPEYEGAPEVLSLLDGMLAEAGERSTVVFLGDLIYPSGLPPVTSPARQEAEKRIDAQLEIVEDHPGGVVFVPGNHDWGGVGLGGNRAAVLRLEEYVEAALGRDDAFLPDQGFPGPVEVQLTDDIALIVLDTQWWLEDSKPYGNTGTYELETEGEFLLELDDVLWRNADKHLVAVAHHPVFSNGEHGGFFTGLQTLLSGERIARGYLGTPQDLSNLKYRRLRQGLISVFQHHRDLVYAAGHEHSLQYFHHADQHYVVSGSGSKSGHVESGHGASFVSETKGFAGLDYYTDGSIWLNFFAPSDDGTPRVLYSRRIREPNAPLVAVREGEYEYGEADTLQTAEDPTLPDVTALPEEPVRPDIDEDDEEPDTARAATPQRPFAETVEAQAPYTFVAEDTVVVAANESYDTSGFKKFLLGEHYREVWAMPVSVPVIDLSRTAGGLTPLQKGGGLQTISLRLQGGDGDQYVLRSIDKDPSATVPEYLRETIAHDVVKDQIAAMHPYGAFILPKLATAAGIYHTQPTLTYIPDDPQLGFYRPVFGGMLALFEIRPDEAQTDEARLGYADNVIGTPKLIEEIEEDNDERVDQRSFAKARLFDMMIGDWDRHRDQWRWAEFDVTPGKIYRPIPRDRDFALFKFGGFLPYLIKKSGNIRFRRFTNFERLYDDILGLNFNGANMDRRFASSLERQDWLTLADSLKSVITDEVIDDAVRDFPEAVYEHHGRHIAEVLKKRRDLLDRAADRYYEMLAHTVDVVGSDKHERFEVVRLNADSTLVVMYKTKKEGDIDRELYRRVLLTSETREVRLYGLDGNDYFKVTGDVRNGILVRAVGGAGEDTFADSSSVGGGTHHTIFHDTVEGNEWVTSRGTEVIRSDEPKNNVYQMLRFEIGERRPLIHVSRNTDDGVLLGGGVKIVDYGFRKTPYAAEHHILATAATRRRAFNAHYRGHYVEQFGKWDGYLEADALADRNYRNFYGLGNDTDLDDRNFYRARLGRISLEPSLSRNPFYFTTVRFGPRFEFTTVEHPTDFDTQPNRFTEDDFRDKYFVGIQGELHVDGTDTLAATEHGARWLNSVSANLGVRNTDAAFVRLTSELSYFYTFHNPTRVTIGLRGGAATNIGRYEFYQANTLGGQDNLRGFRKTRFAGHTAIFSNLDVRMQLLDYNIYLMRGIAGVMAFYDIGRVWSDGFGGDLFSFHQGYGGGIWIAPFNKLAFTATVGVSEENVLFDISAGFQF